MEFNVVRDDLDANTSLDGFRITKGNANGEAGLHEKAEVY